MKIISTVALISINATFFVQLASFLLFMVILQRIMIRPLRSMTREREFKLETLEADIAKARQDHDEVLDQLKASEMEARAAALRVKQDQEAEGQAEAERIVAQTRGEIDALRREGARALQAQVAQARDLMRAEAQSLAQSMVAKILEHKGTG